MIGSEVIKIIRSTVVMSDEKRVIALKSCILMAYNFIAISDLF
jgi:hypothetical protein